MNALLHLDFETRSALDLTEVGLTNYLKHPTTAVWCMAYAFNDEAVQLWTPGEPIDELIYSHIYHGKKIVAHGAHFEMRVWNALIQKQHKISPIVPSMCDCTLARCCAMSLPAALYNAALALGVSSGKDMAGHRLMLQMCKPRKEYTNGTYDWWDDAERLGRLYKYCIQDVVTEREVHHRTVPLSPYEQRVWELDYEINRRGFCVDLELVDKAIAIVDLEQTRLSGEIKEITEGYVGFPSENVRIVKWLQQNEPMSEWIKEKGLPTLDSIAKNWVTIYLLHDDLPEKARRVLEIRQESGRTSVAKLYKMKLLNHNGRVYDQFAYCGADKTGRWAGRDVQPHNIPRPTMDENDIQQAICVLSEATTPKMCTASMNKIFTETPMNVIVNMLRRLITAPTGYELVVGDFSNIEGRGLAWLAGEQWKLDAFEAYDIGIGPDIYKLAYHKSFGKPIDDLTDKDRQLGKVQELTLQFGGGDQSPYNSCSTRWFGVKR